MNRILFYLILIFLLSGCDAVQDLKGMFEKQELVQTFIKKKYGWESQVGFNISNGLLTQVTLILNADEVRNERVSSLEAMETVVMSNHLKCNPQTSYIQIVIVPIYYSKEDEGKIVSKAQEIADILQIKKLRIHVDKRSE